jgi:molybdenum cofactor synthesis domain-containing protein
MAESFHVESINISTEKGTIKQPVDSARILETGIEHDAHGGQWHRQISLLAAEDVEQFASTLNRSFAWGEFAENITTRGIDLSRVAVLDRLMLDTVLLEITQIGKACHHGCDIFKEVGACIMPSQGLFARVLKPGKISTGMAGTWLPRPTKIMIVTLSDRAFNGVYEDESGPAIEQGLTDHFKNKRDHPEFTTHLIPDNPHQLTALFKQAVAEEVDLVLTTGGTGLGPRDHVPETTQKFLTRNLSGLMEHIRLKYGAEKPGALLSRGLAGTHKNTFIMNMPGSVKGVKEYTHELLTVWDHIRRMIHSIDQHS